MSPAPSASSPPTAAPVTGSPPPGPPAPPVAPAVALAVALAVGLAVRVGDGVGVPSVDPPLAGQVCDSTKKSFLSVAAPVTSAVPLSSVQPAGVSANALLVPLSSMIPAAPTVTVCPPEKCSVSETNTRGLSGRTNSQPSLPATGPPGMLSQ